jgi:hypothetical protein
MAKSKLFRVLSLFLVFLLIQTSLGSVYAADDNRDQHISGKVMDPDKKKPIAHAKVRIVQQESGESRETETNVNGCYDFDKVLAPGTYALSTTVKNTEYILADKIKVEPKKNLMACVALAENNSLEIVTKHCKCREFPWLVLVLGTGAAAGLLIGGQNDKEEASPSQP